MADPYTVYCRYWNFFTALDASELQEADLSRMYEVNHGLYPSNVPEENGRDVWMVRPPAARFMSLMKC
jgi:hypothetical protein